MQKMLARRTSGAARWNGYCVDSGVKRDGFNRSGFARLFPFRQAWRGVTSGSQGIYLGVRWR
jgi:hypothetical protein